MFPIILSATLGGVGPGLLSTLIVSLAIDYLVIPPVGSLAIAERRDLALWSFLIVNGVLVSLLAELTRRSWRQTAAALSEQLSALKLLQAIAENSDDAIFAKDAEGRYILFNHGAERLTGKAAEAALGHDDHAIFSPEQACLIGDVDREVMATGLARQYEWRLSGTNGDKVVEVTKAALRGVSGSVVGVFGIGRDITERKRTAEALGESEGRFRALVEQSLAGIYIIQDGLFRYVNPGFAHIFGYDSPADIVERVPVTDLVSPEYRDRVVGNIRQRIEGEATDMQYTFTGVRRDGRRVDVEVHGRVFEYQGRPAVIGLILDVTSRRAAENALIESEGRFHDIVKASADWIWEVDAEGRYTYASDSVRDMLGYEPAEMLGRTPFDLMPPDEAARVRAEFAAVAARRQPFRDLDNINLRKDGSLCHVQTNGMPILDDKGNLLGYRGLDRDITDRRRAELALRESEARFRSLFDKAGVAMMIHDPDTGEIVQANRRAVEAYGYATLAELHAADFWLEPPYSEAEAVQLIRKAAREGDLRFEWKSRGRHGGIFWEDVLLQRIDLGGVEYVISVTTDITASKAAQEEIRARNAELERFNRASVGRELDMIALKKRINELSGELGRAPPFDLGYLDGELDA